MILNPDVDFLLKRQDDLKCDLNAVNDQLKRHMSWAIISNAYGFYRDEDDEDPETFDYDIARIRALRVNSRIDFDEDKAYRDVVCLIGWTWRESGERVYDDDNLRLLSTQHLEYYEVPMPAPENPEYPNWL